MQRKNCKQNETIVNKEKIILRTKLYQEQSGNNLLNDTRMQTNAKQKVEKGKGILDRNAMKK